ncbi:MAG TPA: ABC transporter permease, partial [Kiloniellaceae bacterium]|nr:ABC transporter permease [Kiloniellaceae bacterium]
MTGRQLQSLLGGLARVLLPVALALIAGAVLLLLLGKDPLAYYGYVIKRGLLSPTGLQASITRTIPLLTIAAGLIVAFRAGLWNLGVDGQFLLAAVCVAALAPALVTVMPVLPAILICFVVAFAVGALWSLIPALLKARHGINEIISTLMMSFLGVSLANVLIKIPFNDPTTTVPQTATLPVEDRLLRLGDTTIPCGILIALAAVLLVHVMMERTSLGMKLQIVGANPRAARHAGLNLQRLTVVAFALSAGLAGLAGALDVLGVHGTIRADWNPAYGILVIPLVFLARFNGYAVIAF